MPAVVQELRAAARLAGVASAARDGALHEIWRRGGGAVESHPDDGTVSMFESHGFERTRRLGEHRWVVAKVVA